LVTVSRESAIDKNETKISEREREEEEEEQEKIL
jgi:hypothetical protein